MWKIPACKPAIYKFHTCVLEKRIRMLVENKIEDEPAGFRPGKQTPVHIFFIRNIIEKTWERDRSTFMTFLDLEAAFD